MKIKPSIVGKTFALNRWILGWGMVTVVTDDGSLVWVRDDDHGGSYLAARDDLYDKIPEERKPIGGPIKSDRKYK